MSKPSSRSSRGSFYGSASRQLTLIGDQIENPFNITAMRHAAQMFGLECNFHGPEPGSESAITLPQVVERYSPILALDNLKGSQSIYGYQLPSLSHAAILVGNERRGISRPLRAAANQAIEIPMISKRLNCINVAAASAVALFYLTNGYKGKMQSHRNPQRRRPELLLIGGSDHAELGSAIRSATAFGWTRALLEDRINVWFESDRIIRSEGRAAARRGRNQIKLVRAAGLSHYLFREAIIVTTKRSAPPLPQLDLARGSQQVVILADENGGDVSSEDWSRVAEQIQFASIDLPVESFTYHFRHPASIALAEISRQVGQMPPWRSTHREPLYRRTQSLIEEAPGEIVDLEDLSNY